MVWNNVPLVAPDIAVPLKVSAVNVVENNPALVAKIAVGGVVFEEFTGVVCATPCFGIIKNENAQTNKNRNFFIRFGYLVCNWIFR